MVILTIISVVVVLMIEYSRILLLLLDEIIMLLLLNIHFGNVLMGNKSLLLCKVIIILLCYIKGDLDKYQILF